MPDGCSFEQGADGMPQPLRLFGEAQNRGHRSLALPYGGRFTRLQQLLTIPHRVNTFQKTGGLLLHEKVEAPLDTDRGDRVSGAVRFLTRD